MACWCLMLGDGDRTQMGEVFQMEAGSHMCGGGTQIQII